MCLLTFISYNYIDLLIIFIDAFMIFSICSQQSYSCHGYIYHIHDNIFNLKLDNDFFSRNNVAPYTSSIKPSNIIFIYLTESYFCQDWIQNRYRMITARRAFNYCCRCRCFQQEV